MSPQKCENCLAAEQIIREWTQKQGHERCWYYPDLFLKLAGLFKIAPPTQPRLPPRIEFEEGCRRYQNEEYEKPKE